MSAIETALVSTALLLACVTPASALDVYLSRQKDALGLILDAANSLCYTLKQEGRLVETNASGSTRATLKAAVARIQSLDISGTGDLSEKDYEGVERHALPAALESSQTCKRAIFDKLVVMLVPRVADTGLPISKSVHLSPRSPDHKPSINCAKTNEPLEELLCADDDLAQWDGIMGELYWTQMRQLSVDGRRTLRQQQIGWLKSRNLTCHYSPLESYTLEQLSPAKPCILQMTMRRVEELRK